MEYTIFGYPPPVGRHWMYSKERANELILAGKLRANPKSGKPQYLLDESNQTMLDTNWTDLQEYDTKFNFPNGEKNVDLLKRIIGMLDDPNAIILDSFAGSGTTAHAVLALNKEDGGARKFILVECEDYADTVTAERVRRVIAGVPEAKDAALREGLGGAFTYCELGDAIGVDGMLTGEALPPFSALAAWLLHTATGVSAGPADLQSMDEDGHFYSDERRDYFLLYEPSIDWLRSDEAVLNEARARRIRKGRTKEAIVFGAAKYFSQQDLTADYRITFCQLPYQIHRLR